MLDDVSGDIRELAFKILRLLMDSQGRRRNFVGVYSGIGSARAVAALERHGLVAQRVEEAEWYYQLTLDGWIALTEFESRLESPYDRFETALVDDAVG